MRADQIERSTEPCGSLCGNPESGAWCRACDGTGFKAVPPPAPEPAKLRSSYVAVQQMRIREGYNASGYATKQPLVAACGDHSASVFAWLQTPHRRPGPKQIERVIDDLAVHAAEKHVHTAAPQVAYLSVAYPCSPLDLRWWWRGYLTAHLLEGGEAMMPKFSNAGGAANRLKRRWRDGFEVGVREREEADGG